MKRHTGETIWDADAPSAKPGSSAGSNSATPTDSPLRSIDFPPPEPSAAEQVMLRLALAIEEQNRALWALVEQTAALIEQSLGQPDDDDLPTRYLDGSPISRS